MDTMVSSLFLISTQRSFIPKETRTKRSNRNRPAFTPMKLTFVLLNPESSSTFYKWNEWKVWAKSAQRFGDVCIFQSNISSSWPWLSTKISKVILLFMGAMFYEDSRNSLISCPWGLGQNEHTDCVAMTNGRTYSVARANWLTDSVAMTNGSTDWVCCYGMIGFYLRWTILWIQVKFVKTLNMCVSNYKFAVSNLQAQVH